MVYDPYKFRKSEETDRLSDDKEDDLSPFQYYEDWQDVDDGIARPCFAMQFTGLKDSKGVEIYEGDIFIYRKHGGYLLESFVGCVNWNDYGAWGYDILFSDGEGYSNGELFSLGNDGQCWFLNLRVMELPSPPKQ